jgi:hypothetical protein
MKLNKLIQGMGSILPKDLAKNGTQGILPLNSVHREREISEADQDRHLKGTGK